jgi:hypothetical protein
MAATGPVAPAASETVQKIEKATIADMPMAACSPACVIRNPSS